jgi:hypothetical protein
MVKITQAEYKRLMKIARDEEASRLLSEALPLLNSLPPHGGSVPDLIERIKAYLKVEPWERQMEKDGLPENV